MQIEEIGSNKDKKVKFDYTRRGEEVRRLAQSMGAERNASSQAASKVAPQIAKGQDDVSSISDEAIQGLNFLDSSNRTSNLINGLQQSFQGNTGDHGHSGRESAKRGRWS